MSIVRDAARLLGLGLFGTGLAVTAFSQMPGNSFDRIRRKDFFGLIPNWKFFAPIPATDDHEVFHRIRGEDGTWQDWQRTSPPMPRRLAHLVWFPGRRADKGVFDHASELAQLAATADPTELVLSSSYLVVAATVRRRVGELRPVPAHQFAIIKHAGSDESVTPEVVLLSPAFESHPGTAMREAVPSRAKE
jgi:hypothetical protein